MKGASQIFLLGIFLLGIFLSVSSVMGVETPTSTSTTISNVTVTKQVAIAVSNNFSIGVAFSSLDPNTNDNNASKNFNSTVNLAWNNETLYWVTISSTTNTPIDICTRVNETLRSGSNTIPNAGYTWNTTTSNNASFPSISVNQIVFTTSFDNTNKIASDTQSGTFYVRYLLDVPSAQQAGTYVNQIEIKGTENTTAC